MDGLMGNNPTLAFVLVGAIVAIVSFGIIAAIMQLRFRMQFERRLGKISGRPISTEETLMLLRNPRDESTNQTILKILPSLERTKAGLLQSGLRVDIKLYVLIVLAVTAGVSISTKIPLLPDWAEPLVIAFGMHMFFEKFILKGLVERYKRKTVEQLAHALNHMVRSLRVGQSVEAAVHGAEKVIGSPLRQAFESFNHLVSVGVPVSAALQAVARDLDIAEFDFFVNAVVAHLESGGNLANVLQNLANIIRDRMHMRMKVAALAAEGKMTAIILSVLPIAVFTFLVFAKPGYVEPFFTRDIGETMLAIGFGLIGVGYYLMSQMAKLRV